MSERIDARRTTPISSDTARIAAKAAIAYPVLELARRTITPTTAAARRPARWKSSIDFQDGWPE